MAWWDDIWDVVQDVGDGLEDIVSWLPEQLNELVFGDEGGIVVDNNEYIDNFLALIDGALKSSRDWVIEQILKLTEEIRVWKHRFRIAVSEWMENPLLFWLTIAGIAGLVIALPSIAKLVVSSKAYLFASEVYSSIKKGIGTFMEKIKYVQLIQANKILLILNPDYNNFWRDIDEAFMALAEEIELGVGTLNNISMSIRDLYYSTYTLVGMDSDTIEMKFYEDSTAFWAKSQKNWERYVRDPKLIFDDIQRELVYPVLDEKARLGIDKAKNDLAVWQSIDSTIENVDAFRVSLNSLIESMPDNVRDIIDEKLGDYDERVNAFFEVNINPLRSKIDESVSIIKSDMIEMEAAIFENSLKVSTQGDDLISILFDGTLDISGKRKALSGLLDKILESKLSKDNEVDTLGINLLERDVDDSPTVEIDIVPDEYVPLISISLKTIQASAEPWFVGEY